MDASEEYGAWLERLEELRARLAENADDLTSDQLEELREEYVQVQQLIDQLSLGNEGSPMDGVPSAPAPANGSTPIISDSGPQTPSDS